MTEINLKKGRNKKLIFFNDAVEYFDKFDTHEIFINRRRNESDNLTNPNQLRDLMLDELNNLKDLIANNPDLKFKALTKEQKKFFYDFINFYSICPVCGNCNHYSHLKRFYFDESTTSIKHKLIRLMKLKSKLQKNFNVNFGIPCCNCFKKNFT